MRKWIDIITEIEINPAKKWWDQQIDQDLHDVIYELYSQHLSYTKNYTIPAKKLYNAQDKIKLKTIVLNLKNRTDMIDTDSQMVDIINHLVLYFVYGKYNFD